MKPVEFPLYILLNHWCIKSKLHLGVSCFKAMVVVALTSTFMLLSKKNDSKITKICT